MPPIAPIEEESLYEFYSDLLFGPAEASRSDDMNQRGAKRLGQDSGGTNHATILYSQDGLLWTGEIYMGKYIKMDLIYDTGSDWLIVEGSNCDNCEGNTYNIDPNLALGAAEQLATSKSTRVYGDATLVGREYTDTVCLLFSACVENFEFFLIEEQRGLKEPYDGVLGMSRNKVSHLSPDEGNVSGPLYVEHLFSAGVIPENKFSLYFTQPGSESWADLGEPDLTNIRSDANLVEIQML